VASIINRFGAQPHKIEMRSAGSRRPGLHCLLQSLRQVVAVRSDPHTETGWSADVMSPFMLLCERAGTAYPLNDFIAQANAVLGQIENAKGNWLGTNLAARTAATVQRLADANFPLRADEAQGLLRILDALIDLGDRRSAALEQTEAFKNVQVR
jgi:hypothetical protein